MLTNHSPQDYIQTWSWQPQINTQHLYYTYEKEHMFEKPLTPSDVGKLNRLVIPKQYAEKYFPLDSESGEKGLLLNFEDEAGKAWRFRYSYWTSSQSYVLTKGWSRYVKEKRLEAGDVVYFERVHGGGTGDRLYIMWRKRESNANASSTGPGSAKEPWSPAACSGGNGSYPASPVSSSYNPYSSTASVQQDQHPYYFQGDHQTRNGEERSSSSANTAAVQTPSNSRRLRLFGVNLDCVITEPDSSESVPDMNGSMFGTMNNQGSYAPVPNYYWRNG